MTKQAEGRISSAIMDLLRQHGYFCFKVHGNEYMMKGLPDIIVCASGLFIGLETKTPDKRNNVSEAQRIVHERIRASGGLVEVVCGAKEALLKVRDMLGEPGVPTIPRQNLAIHVNRCQGDDCTH